MRYWHPFTAEAVAALESAQCDEIVLLPLYPQYSSTTTGSSLNEWNRRFHPNGAPVHVVTEFYRHEGYLDALAETIDRTLEALRGRVAARAYLQRAQRSAHGD